MLVKPNLDVLLHDPERGLENKFILVTLATKRARQINDGSAPLVEVDSKKPVTIAIHEIYYGKVRVKQHSSPRALPVNTEDSEAAALAAALGTPGGLDGAL